ncbi:MAG: hypothetical protein HKP61_00565, partial [Dactylosporangium sp.]|nr:hypothetical protein [Dactylosporangium sp.]NNJ59464.1 hypothetical protein [Dactylosporangium sp.]
MYQISRLRVFGALATLLTVLVSGCGGDTPSGDVATLEDAGQESGGAAKPDWNPVDPPTTFDVQRSVEIPVKRSTAHSVTEIPDVASVLFDQTTLYVAGTNELLIVDAVAGQTMSTITPDGEPIREEGSQSVAPPVLATVGGERLVLVPFVVKLPSQGTSKARNGIELVAISVDSGGRVWNTVVTLPAEQSGSPQNTAYIAGIQDTTLVLGTEHAGTYAVDLQTRTEAWRDEDLGDATLAAGVVVGQRTLPD